MVGLQEHKNHDTGVYMKLNVGDILYEPLSKNTGEIKKIFEHPDGKIINIRWQVEGFLPHDTEHFYKKVLRSVKNGEYLLTTKNLT